MGVLNMNMQIIQGIRNRIYYTTDTTNSPALAPSGKGSFFGSLSIVGVNPNKIE